MRNEFNHSRLRRPRTHPVRFCHGLTLIEVSLATIIVGAGILSLMQLFASLTQHNATASRMTAAMFLANNVQEAMADLPFSDPSGAGFGTEEGTNFLLWDDVDDFHNWTSAAGAPIDSRRVQVPDLSNYTQRVSVTQVSPEILTSAQVGTDAERVTVTIAYRPGTSVTANDLYSLSWVRMRD